MYIENSFKTAIADVFYDKEFTLCEIVEAQDADGWASRSLNVTDETFLGNIRYDNLAKVQEDYGLKEEIDFVISTQETVEAGSIIKYGAEYLEVVTSIPFDSHNLLMGKQCLLESLTSISS